MRRVGTPVPIAVARRRALSYLSGLNRLTLAKCNEVGYEIWPGVNMTSQGMGGAASRILRGLQKDGLAKWVVTPGSNNWGWRITTAGRSALDSVDDSVVFERGE